MPTLPYFSAAPCSIANSNNAPGLSCACKTGYKGTISWNGATPIGSCTPTECTGDNANPPANGAVSKRNGDQHNSVAVFSCNDGFILSGPAAIVCYAASADEPWPAPEVPPTCTGVLIETRSDATHTVHTHRLTRERSIHSIAHQCISVLKRLMVGLRHILFSTVILVYNNLCMEYLVTVLCNGLIVTPCQHLQPLRLSSLLPLSLSLLLLRRLQRLRQPPSLRKAVLLVPSAAHSRKPAKSVVALQVEHGSRPAGGITTRTSLIRGPRDIWPAKPTSVIVACCF